MTKKLNVFLLTLFLTVFFTGPVQAQLCDNGRFFPGVDTVKLEATLTTFIERIATTIRSGRARAVDLIDMRLVPTELEPAVVVVDVTDQVERTKQIPLDMLVKTFVSDLVADKDNLFFTTRGCTVHIPVGWGRTATDSQAVVLALATMEEFTHFLQYVRAGRLEGIGPNERAKSIVSGTISFEAGLLKNSGYSDREIAEIDIFFTFSSDLRIFDNLGPFKEVWLGNYAVRREAYDLLIGCPFK